MKRNLKNKRKTIGIILNHLNDQYQTQILKGVEEYVLEHDLNFIIFVGRSIYSNYNYIVHYHVIHDFLNKNNIDGLILIAGSMSDGFFSFDKLVDFCERLKPLPMITIGEIIGDIPAVLPDNKRGMKELIIHLIEHHEFKHIAFCGGPNDNQEALDRLDGYKEALEEHSIPFRPEYVTEGTFTRQSGVQAVETLFDNRKLNIEAIACVDDATAFGVFGALKKRGIKVPEEITLVGFDDVDESSFMTPPLTTVRQPLSELGGTSAKIIHNIIEKNTTPPPLTYLPTKLIIRQSCECFTHLFINRDFVINTITENQYIKVINNNKIEIIEHMQTILNESKLPEKTTTNWGNELFDNLLMDLSGTSSRSYFLKNINSIINTINQDEKNNITNFMAWQKAVEYFRDEILKIFLGNPIIHLFTEIFHKANTLLIEVIQRTQFYQNVKMQFDFYIIQEVSSTIISAFKLSRLMEILHEELPRLGLRCCYIGLYATKDWDSKAENWRLPEYSTLAMGYNENGPLDPDDIHETFITINLLPNSIEPSEKRFTYKFMPLSYLDEHFGYILFDYNLTANITYEALRTQISTAVKGALLINERIEALMEAKRANKLKSEFLANMSHEIRTPMNAILGFTDVLLEKIDDAYNRKRLKIIKRSGNILLNLINDILDFSKIEADKIEINKQTFDLRVTINHSKELFAKKAKEKGLELVMQVAESVPPFVIGDEYRINQIMINILGNAVKFTKEGYIIVVCEYNQEDEQATISIADSGIGIEQSKLDVIFSPFEQADSSNAREYGGTGLGLAITQKLTKLMGGEITVQSEVGKGTRFTITLPLKEKKLKEGLKIKQSNKHHSVPVKHELGEKLIQSWLNNMEDTFSNLILDGVRNFPHKIKKLENAIMYNNRNDIKFLAHEIKGVYGNLQMKEIYENARKIDEEINKDEYDLAKIKVWFYYLTEISDSIPVEYLSRPDNIPVKTGKLSAHFRILLAEDNEINQQLVLTFLESISLSCDIAQNGKEVLEMLEYKEYDLLLLDIQMPIMDGVQTITHIRKNEKLQDLYVIALTAHAMKSDAERYLSAGCNDYLSKPLDKGLFIERINSRIIAKGTQKETLKKAVDAGTIDNNIPAAIDNELHALLQDIIKELKECCELFNDEKITELAYKIGEISTIPFFTGIKEQLLNAASNFDEEELVMIIENLEKELYNYE